MQPESREPNMTDEHYECDAFERRMHQLLDARHVPEEDEQLQAQAELSAEHRGLLAGQQAMLDGLDLGEAPEISPDFAARCVAAVVYSDRPTTKSRAMAPPNTRWSLIAISTVVAGLLLVAIVPLRSWFAGEGDIHSDAGPEIAVVPNGPATPSIPAPFTPAPSTPAPSTPAPSTPAPIDLAPALPGPAPIEEIDIPPAEEDPQLATHRNATDFDQMGEARAKYRDLYGVFQDLRQRLPRTDGDEDLLAVRPQWIDEFAGGLRPVANSMGDAINVLRQNIAPSGKGTPEEKPQARWPTPNHHRHLA